MRCYKIVRVYFRNNKRRVIKTRVTLEEAQAHCSDPETSSSTCVGKAGKACTRRNGDWFDTYDFI